MVEECLKGGVWRRTVAGDGDVRARRIERIFCTRCEMLSDVSEMPLEDLLVLQRQVNYAIASFATRGANETTRVHVPTDRMKTTQSRPYSTQDDIPNVDSSTSRSDAFTSRRRAV